MQTTWEIDTLTQFKYVCKYPASSEYKPTNRRIFSKPYTCNNRVGQLGRLLLEGKKLDQPAKIKVAQHEAYSSAEY